MGGLDEIICGGPGRDPFRTSRIDQRAEIDVAGDSPHLSLSVGRPRGCEGQPLGEEREERGERDGGRHVVPVDLTHALLHPEGGAEPRPALAERPTLWEASLSALREFADLNDPALENLLWQAIVGAWPASRERLHGYAEKAAREAGTSTNWIDPNAAFERRMHDAVDAVFDVREVGKLIGETVAIFADAGYSNGLSAKILQIASPGVPDVFQGSEIWETSLVDPDNRRPVDFAEREALLKKIDAGWLPEVDSTGAAKLLVTSRALRLRRDHPERFTTYRPVTAAGFAREHIVAFDRGGAIAIATRLPHGLADGGGWKDTTIELSAAACVDVITGARYPGGVTLVAELLDRYPVALVTEDSP